MGNPIADIEVELRRTIVTQAQANDHRKKLNDHFGRLSQDQAVTVLARILTPGKDTLPLDFRRLSRGVRLELMLRLVMLLGAQRTEQFHAALTGTENSPLKKGLSHAFPSYAHAQRDKFLKALVKGVPSGVPKVLLEFRNQGRFTVDNKAEAITKGFVRNLLGPLPDTGKNQMEIRGVVSGHRPDAEYRFSRTIGRKNWKRLGQTWTFLTPPIPAGSDDDSNDGDEDTHADNDHIYSMDSPGLTGSLKAPDFLSNLPSDERPNVTEAVYMLNATETLEVKVGQGSWLSAGQLDWFSVTWLEKEGNTWRRKQGLNIIASGSLIGLDSANTPELVAF